MKTVNSIDWNGEKPEPEHYDDPDPDFGWLIPSKKCDHKLLAGWHSCRELFIEDISDSFESDEEFENGFDVKELSKHLRRLRIAAVYHTTVLKAKDKADLATFLSKTHTAVERGINTINTLEKEVGWPKSTVAELNKKKLVGTGSSVYVFEGSKKWLQAPPLLSLFLLCIRLGKYGAFTNFEISRMADIATQLRKFSAQQDAAFYISSYSKWLTVLKNAKELFFCRPLKDNYMASSFLDGIQNMAYGKCSIPGVKQTWNKIKENKE